MIKGELKLCRDYIVGEVDERLFGSFVEHMGATVYNGIYQPKHSSADEDGCRQDVIMQTKALGVTTLRYPGGNFSSGFNWEDSVGPISERPEKLDLAWRSLEPNSFGLNEFMRWIKKVACQPIMTVNLGTRSGDDARNLLEYCNFPRGGHYSNLRIQHGIKAPHGIKTWCLGNELDGPWQIAAKTAEEYSRIACEAAKMMRMVDPAIELVAVGSSHARMESFPEWDRIVLTHAYDYVDYISLHHYIDKMMDYAPLSATKVVHEQKNRATTKDYFARNIHVDRQIHTVIAICDYVRALHRGKKDIYLAFDEYNVIAEKKHGGTDFVEWTTGSMIDCGEHSMEDALVFGSMMLSLLRRADRVKIACQSLLVNTGPLIVALGDIPAFLNTIAYPFMHLSLYGRGEVLYGVSHIPTFSTDEIVDIPYIDTLAVHDGEHDRVTVFAVNRCEAPVSLSVDLRDFGSVISGEHIAMHSDDLSATNNRHKPQAVIPRTRPFSGNGDMATHTLAGYSWNVLRFTMKGRG